MPLSTVNSASIRTLARRSALRIGARAQRTNPNGVYFNSFQGQFSDSPRAIYEEFVRRGLPVEESWRVRDRHVQDFPPQVNTVAPSTWTHAKSLAQSRYAVTNVQMHQNLKPPGATWLQTWHGTPLKMIGFDIVKSLSREDERNYTRGVAQWDYLISPNPFSTPIFREAFRYDGPLLETGLPRNDVLNAPDREAIRARTREELGLDPDVTAVLYAPTFRDNWTNERGWYTFDIPLDLAAMDDALGDTHRLLVRLHRAFPFQSADTGLDFAQNVSAYPDIRDLYLAADVLVTDYSSVMFDFAVTGKPMAFFAHDIETYGGEVRGFYFDLQREAPGPFLHDTPALIDALASMDGLRASYAEAYAAFRAKFCAFDDGHATQRVVDAVFDL